MAKILDINTSLQVSNQIHKSETDNTVSQIRESAQGIIFSQTDNAKKPVYKYGDVASNGFPYMSFTGANSQHIKASITKGLTLGEKRSFEFYLWFKRATTGVNESLFIVGEGSTFASFDWQLAITSSNTLTLYVYNSGGYTEKVIANNVIDTNWHNVFVGFNYNGTTYDIYILYDGVYVAFNLNTTFNTLINPPVSLAYNNNSGSQQYFTGSILNAVAYTTTTTIIGSSLTGSLIFTPVINPFTHIQRYREDGFKKAFFSSKYLKDAVIGNDNKITSVKDSIGGYELIGQGTKPTLTRNSGFRFDVSSQYLYKSGVTGLNINSGSDVFGMCWIKCTTVNVSKNAFGFGQFLFELPIQGGANLYNHLRIGISGATSALCLEPYVFYKDADIWHHAAFCMKGGTCYVFFDGVLAKVQVSAVNQYTAVAFTVGAMDGNVDDCLAVIGDSIIDPTGFSVGEKVFEPPMSGQFDGIIKQY